VTAPGLWSPLADVRPDLPFALLDAYAAETCRWNRAIRIVGPAGLAGIRGQIQDALLPFLLHPPPFPLLDIGSGAGLPGVPLAIAFPGQPVTCIEAQQKKAAFLRHVAVTLGLRNVQVIRARAEVAPHAFPAMVRSFGAATARAVGEVEMVLRLADPFLRPGGVVYLPKGDVPPTTVAAWDLIASIPYRPPPGLGPRRILIYRPRGR
jgi:16S rRNA (guanine527-N7)-methyltransferase